LGTNDSNGLWIRTDEDDDVVLQFHGHRFGLAPLAFLRYGERVGQGQRCAFLRLTRQAEVQLPIASRVLVTKGQRVTAGADVLAKLPHP
jgi:phosphatidylserine decarboxylase